jgi:hypothetical protein
MNLLPVLFRVVEKRIWDGRARVNAIADLAGFTPGIVKRRGS